MAATLDNGPYILGTLPSAMGSESTVSGDAIKCAGWNSGMKVHLGKYPEVTGHRDTQSDESLLYCTYTSVVFSDMCSIGLSPSHHIGT